MEEKKYTAKVRVTKVNSPDEEPKKMGRPKAKLTEKFIERSIEVPLMEDYVDMKLPRKWKFNNGSFVTVFQKALTNIALFAKLTKNEHQLLLYLLGSCLADNSICIDLVQISNDLKMDRSNASKALKGLVQRNIVLRKDGYRYGKNPLPMELSLNFDQLNYNLAYTGRTKEYGKRKNVHPPLTESDGTTLLEVHEAGKPIRRLTANGKTELIDPNTGEVFPELPFEEWNNQEQHSIE